MQEITISTLLENMTYYVQKAKNGALFVYPTDTIYGVWGIVTWDVVDKINNIKQRLPGKHYSIIAPSFDRISDHFKVWDDFESSWISLYQEHGPLTLLLPIRYSECRDDSINHHETKDLESFDPTLLTQSNMVWVRLILLPHPIQQFVIELWEPIITTSVNISGQPSITHPDQLNSDQLELIDFAIIADTLNVKWSTVINYVTWEKIR